jgi:methylmalonyl-CoA/ethylmalonyl-CoA epimerase
MDSHGPFLDVSARRVPGKGRAMKIDHIGYAVTDLEKAAASFSVLGYAIRESCGGKYVDDPSRRVRICFLSDPCGVKVELVAPFGEKSPVAAWLDKNGPSPYHIAYGSADIPADIANLKKMGFLLVEPPGPALVFGGRPVAFLYGKAAGLIELVPLDSA